MLEGIRVIEYATYMAAPGAGCILRDWGADVVKIEPPGGDPIRLFFRTIGTDYPDNPVFDFDNRGKQSIIIDTSKPEGQALIREMVKDADVFLTNVRPGGLARSGLDYDSLKQLNPKLVYCSLSGYGLEGPDADRPGFDIASFWSRTGVANLTIPKGGEPFPLRTAFGDHTTSIAAAAGICAALVEAQRTGNGRLVEASLFRTGLYTMGSDLAIQLFFGRVASTKGRHEQNVPISNFYQSKDEKWFCIVARQGETDWAPLCRVINRPELATDPRFNNAKGRRANNAEVVNLLDAGFGAYKMEELAGRLDAESIAWAPVQTLAEVAADPQAHAAGAIVQTPSSKGDGSTYASPASPVRFPGADDGPKGPSPAPGEHTRQVLTSLGRTEADIETLYKSGIVF
ncbi:E-cinnamoyl-CoA:R-phenyllactate CoA transferase large subunit [Hyphomonas polymorpha PS728]|uniref:E-cinnamoyl-CoA:R-phenyllactate CoA transferase large subunit n=1 Tax=Hyphomonas polymorpha PS728 TaxID=1280954 RepID=A0A062V9A0_9PROT|nr:CaiB/BaiF CoA-transferase family protein [Hyphomonas polymorpha]KCZ96699.1 E-cinnamoyl-CoA:R-phenyllactate CoA transferase large subunit [Hyphomonas polymorpha PS728]